jgi:hypothetical protein
MQDNEDKETSTDEVQTGHKRIQKEIPHLTTILHLKSFKADEFLEQELVKC